ncbi:Lrp/AsnC family transcriptional regulator [Vogesella sp. LIG4]|uniref:Lrp/AsnC family transcriptional regulator n=1 Tax=Vogesella sp. LIG4 TaxID=1192162 RepID=UPI00081F8CAA|nr:Lrp/AsnC family transcriptional regulator [Vogesella sp. LIG4]SCK09554.1 DNA-binding transcriptional regulator, Lrp family [Vogesella sp. LIG4]
MEKKFTLDRIDLKILAVLQQDGRISFQKLSEHVNLTPRPCLERVRRLEKAGIIKGYTAIVDLPQPQHAVVILAEVELADHAVSQQAFTRELLNTPEVLDCWLVSGNFDFLIRIGCRDMKQYRELAERWLNSTAFKIHKILTTTELQPIKRQRQDLPEA